jgi:hypothetical protein
MQFFCGYSSVEGYFFFVKSFDGDSRHREKKSYAATKPKATGYSLNSRTRKIWSVS